LVIRGWRAPITRGSMGFRHEKTRMRKGT